MKKTITISFLTILILGFAAPITYGVSFDKNMPGWEDEQEAQAGDNNQGTTEGIQITASQVPDIIRKITKYFFNAVMIISVMFILLSAFYFLRGGDNPALLKKAKTQLVYAIIGIAIALISFGIEELIQSIIRMSRG